MSTAQRRGWKQSKLASWQQLNTPTQPVVEEAPKVTITPEVEVVDEVQDLVLEVDPVRIEETAELPRIVKKNKKS